MSKMTVGDLRDILDDYDEDTEIRLAVQPSWPLQFTISDVVESDAGVVYITQGNHPDDPYAPREVFGE